MDLPAPHSRFLEDVLPRIRQDPRVTEVVLSGSIANGQPDVYSDVDLIVVVEDAAFDDVMRERLDLIGSWTDLVVGFTGEHVGEPRLIITLVGPPLLHADFKFVRVSDFAERTEEPAFDLQWIEDRFWVWVHYGATKIGRGELFEAIGMLGYLRDTVLGPLAARRAGAPPRGTRHLETIAPAEARALRGTLCGYDRADAGRAFLAAVDLYRQWLGDATVERRGEAEKLAVQYLHDVLGQAD